jgi:hypothetical protein
VTFICAIATPTFIALSADRRLTFDSAARGRRQFDLETKSFVVGGRFLMGYAGVADLAADGERMDIWLTELLVSKPASNCLTIIRDALQQKWDTTASLRNQPHMFLGGSFEVDRKTNRVRPYLFAISNAMDENWKLNARRLQPSFSIRKRSPALGMSLLASNEEELDESERQRAVNIAHAARSLDGGGVDRVRAALVNLNRHASEINDGTVGTQVVVTTMPAAALPVEYIDVEVGSQPSKDYDRSVVSFTSTDPREMHGSVSSFGASLIGGGISMVGLEVRTGGEEFIGPRPNLRDV